METCAPYFKSSELLIENAQQYACQLLNYGEKLSIESTASDKKRITES